MEQRDRAALVSIIGQVASPEPPAAADQPGQPARVVCDRCHAFLSWRQVELVADGCTFRCTACVAASRLAGRWQAILRVMRSPFFYVALLALLSGILYIFGVGRLQPQMLAARDAGRPWFEQQLPRLQMRQGGRVRVHVLMLAQAGKTNAVRTWAELGQQAFADAANHWAGTEAEPHLRTGAAVMLGQAGNPAEAYAQLRQLAPAYPPGSDQYLPYLFYRGRLALELGHQAAALEDLETVLRGIGSGREKLIDLQALQRLLEVDPRQRSAAATSRHAATMAGLDLPAGYMAREIIAHLKAHGVVSLVANMVERQMKEAGAWNRRGEGLIVEPANR